MLQNEPLPPICDPQVKVLFDSFPDDVRPHLLALRQLIFQTAASTEGCGHLTEAIKWGQPSYQTEHPKTGTPIRLGIPKSGTGRYTLYVHCQTTLWEAIQFHYQNEFVFEGTRALILRSDKTYSASMLRHCIAMALMYHRSQPSR